MTPLSDLTLYLKETVSSIANLKLREKGLILVLLMLVCEFSYLGVLGYLLHEAESRAYLEARNKAIAQQAAYMYDAGFEAITALFAYKETKEPAAADLYDTRIHNIEDGVRQLILLTEGDAPKREALSRIVTPARKLTALMRKAKQAIDGVNTSVLDLSPYQREAVELTKQIKPEIEFIGQKSATDETAAIDLERAQNTAQLVFVLGFPLNIVLALVLGLIFTRNLSARIALLVDNVRRVPLKQPLHKLMQGKDELAELDVFLHDMAKQLEELAELKQEFMQMVAHDLRSPLCSIRGTLSLMVDEAYGPVSNEGQKALHSAERSSGRLVQLINDLLDIDKLEAGKFDLLFEPVLLSDVLAKSLDSVSYLAEQKNQNLIIPTTDIDLDADEGRLVQVLVNLLSNAIKFTPAKGTIEVRIGTEAPGTVKVEVIDTGRGMPEEFLPKLFNRFEQVELNDSRLKGGSGLGLAICKALITEHHGEIGVSSEPGRGSTFWFQLPLRQTDASC